LADDADAADVEALAAPDVFDAPAFAVLDAARLLEAALPVAFAAVALPAAEALLAALPADAFVVLLAALEPNAALAVFDFGEDLLVAVVVVARFAGGMSRTPDCRLACGERIQRMAVRVVLAARAAAAAVSPRRR
jgi:hypothetical protein